MIVDIRTRRLRTTEQLRAFVEGNEAVDFRPRNRDEAYGFVQETLKRFGYRGLGKRDKSVVLRFLMAATGISRQQMERLVRQWRETGAVRDRRGGGRGRPFARKYAAVDIRLLAEVDEAYEQMSGLATREVLHRQFEVFGDARFERLATISNGHVYNLRASATYRAKRTAWSKTRPTTVAIGLRQAPEPEGWPGHVRVDTVHQGDRDGVKGIYLINLVDEVTQFEFVGAERQDPAQVSRRRRHDALRPAPLAPRCQPIPQARDRLRVARRGRRRGDGPRGRPARPGRTPRAVPPHRQRRGHRPRRRLRAGHPGKVPAPCANQHRGPAPGPPPSPGGRDRRSRDGARETVSAIRALFLRPGAFDRRSLPTGYLATGASRVRFAERDASGPVPTTPPSPATNTSTKRTAAAGLYVLDHMFFALSIAIETYFQKIADPAGIASTAGVSFTINHIAAVVIPALLGLVWLESRAAVFLIGAGFALLSLVMSQDVPRSPRADNETVVGWAAPRREAAR